MMRIPVWAVGLALALASACAARVAPAPPPPDFPKFPDFVFPSAPAAGPAVAERQDRGWRFLQNGDLRSAEREFSDLLQGRPKLAPAQTGLAYVALARGEPDDAAEEFDRALAWQPSYAPALVGRGQALLALNRSQEALQAFEAAAAADPTLDLGSRIAVLRLRGVQDRIGEARRAAERGDLTAAREGYRTAIADSPESAFLYRELAAVDRRARDLDASISGYRKAIELDPTDIRARIGLAETLEEKGDFEASLAAYSAAYEVEPSPDLDARIQKLRERIATAALPAEHHKIGDAPEVTRADVAATLGLQLAEWLPAGQRQNVLVTDVRGHWASTWIVRVVSAGLMVPFPNHTFQPGLRVTRGDLAIIAARALDVMASRRPAAGAAWQSDRPKIADVPPSHLAYGAIAQAVAAGVLSLEDGSFYPTRPVTGAELLQVVGRLRSIAGPAPARP
jgi:tetratricopeptide (TPR) repeat protein